MENIREALVFINLNYREAISIEQLAQMAHLSRSYFMYCFKKMVGISAMEYIIQLRIKLACEIFAQFHGAFSGNRIRLRFPEPV